MAVAGSVWGRGGARGSSGTEAAQAEEEEDTGVRQQRVRRLVEEELAPVDREEIEARLERTRREFFNRRKILIKNLPSDVTNQDVHDMLRDYELKYCFVDKYKGTAFVTLLNGEQAEAAIKEFHQSIMRDKEITVQLQPTDALLCIANLPQTYTQQQLEELVRPFGNLERCFLVYNEQTGHPKGYGFVEYMKKDSASRAKSDLLGKQLGTRTLYVHWTDVNQLTYDLIHSRCLCVEKLPHAYNDLEELRQIFSNICPPVFCQLAYGQDGQFKGFAVVEYESAEIAEIVQEETDGLRVGGNHIRVSFCAPGSPGRSMLAALIAAEATALNRGKGLLPEPNVLQFLNTLGTSASLQLLLNPLLHGAMGGKQAGILGAAPMLPLLTNPVLSTALLQLALQGQNQTQHQSQQNALPGSSLLLQNQAWTQLLQNEENQAILSKSGIIGDSPLGSLQQNALGLSNPPGPQSRKKMMVEPPSVSCLPSDITQGSSGGSLQSYLGQLSRERESPVMGASASHVLSSPVPQTALQGLPSSVLGSLISGLQKQKREESVSALSVASLLGNPPRDFKIPHGPPLNMHGFRSSVSTTSTRVDTGWQKSDGYLAERGGPSKPSPYKQKLLEQSSSSSRLSSSLSDSSLTPPGYHTDTYSFDYQQDVSPRMEVSPRMYSQSRERASSALGGFGYTRHKMPPPSPAVSSSGFSERSSGSSSSGSYFSSSSSSYFASGLQAGLQQSHLNKALRTSPSGSGSSMLGLGHSSPSSTLLKTPIGGQKRGFSHLIPSPEPSPEGGYVGQHSQGLGGHYADSYLKRKRIF